MIIKILGTGCTNCKKLFALTEEAIKETGKDISIEKVEDMAKIAGYGVMRTPAIVINEKVKVFGRIPKKEEIMKYIQEEE